MSREWGDSNKCPNSAMFLLSSPSFSWQLNYPLTSLFLFQAFKVFERMARQDDEKRRRELEAKLRKKEEEEEAAAAMQLSPAVQEVEVETSAEPVLAPDTAGTPESVTVAQDTAPSPVEPPGATAPAEPQPAALPT